jgi:adenylate cyclase class 2
MQNIEFKAELRNVEAARRQCKLIQAEHAGHMRQVDTYFRLPDGRLKKREIPNQPVAWIFYHRPDRITPKMSNYTILNDEQARRRWGTHGLKPWLTVAKTRELWMIGDVRIHLDDVDDLGTFIEFEAVVSRHFDVRMCHAAIAELRAHFGPLLGEPVAVSYSDLMQQVQAEKEQSARPQKRSSAS